MTIYIFKRNKGNGHKRELESVETQKEAIKICNAHNIKNRHLKTGYWLEWTANKEYLKN